MSNTIARAHGFNGGILGEKFMKATMWADRLLSC